MNSSPPTMSAVPDQKLLDERAATLARSPLDDSNADTGPTVEVLCFTLGPERYALTSAHVLEVARFVDFTPVPGAPDVLPGIMNLRGHVLAIVDLSKLLGISAQQAREPAHVIVLGANGPDLGILAEQALGLETIPLRSILSPSGVGRNAHALLLGVTPEALIILDGARVLADPRLVVDRTDGRAPKT